VDRAPFQIVLYQPDIPQNTGNIVRLCANTGARLHLVEPLGFLWDSTRLQRAGLDYHEFADVVRHASWADCAEALGDSRRFAVETGGTRIVGETAFEAGDVFLFGSETRGLPAPLLATLPPERILRLPMRPNSRSLNLSNAVAVTVYEAWRQLGFPGAAG
jgi:tRNA (cytidine/uridine-2'-O-)-methyltransferase